MNKKIVFSLAWLLCFGILFVGCKDDNEDLPGQGSGDGNWLIEVTGPDTDGSKNEAVIDMFGRYYSIYTIQKGECDAAMLLHTESEWLTLMADTLPADGILQILAQENREARERTATINVVSAGNPERQTVITIRQRSESSYDENDSNPYSDFRVGYGFSAFDEFKSPRSVRGKVIDVSRLMLYDSDSTFYSTQEVLRGREDFTITNSWSLQEMSSKLTQEMVSTTKFLGVKKTTRRYKEVATKDVREQACVYARLQKTVATRSIDGGALRYLVGLPSDKLTYGLPFTAEFKEAYDAIVNASGEQQTKAIQDMLDKYGTHLVMEASVGCMMDMTLTFDKSESYNLESEAEQKSRSIFGRSSGNSSSTKTDHMTCNINNENCIRIFGGSADTRKALENQVKTLTSASQLSPDSVEAWLASVSVGMLKDHRENFEVVDFNFIPIWELFSDPKIIGHIQQQVIEMANRSDCNFTNAELSIDNYKIDLSNPELTQFGTGSDASLVRLVRVNDENNMPILEICQEYVPKICSDRRITVFYPVFAGMTRIGQGLFPGEDPHEGLGYQFEKQPCHQHEADPDGCGEADALQHSVAPVRAVIISDHRLHGRGYAHDHLEKRGAQGVDDRHRPYVQLSSEKAQLPVAHGLDDRVGPLRHKGGYAHAHDAPDDIGPKPHVPPPQRDRGPPAAQERGAPYRADCLRKDRGQRRAAHAHSEHEYEKGVEGDVGQRAEQDGHHSPLGEALGVDVGVHAQRNEYQRRSDQVDMQVVERVAQRVFSRAESEQRRPRDHSREHREHH